MTDLPRHLLWLDLETTDIDIDTCYILELAWELTDWRCEHSIAASEAIITAPPDWRMKCHPAALAIHEDSGLAAELDATSTCDPGPNPVLESMDRLVMLLEALGEPVPLAGSGVAHFDRILIARKFPILARHLTYWSIDTGVLRRVDLAHASPRGSTEPPAHRARADITQAQHEYRRIVDTLILGAGAARMGSHPSVPVGTTR